MRSNNLMQIFIAFIFSLNLHLSAFEDHFPEGSKVRVGLFSDRQRFKSTRGEWGNAKVRSSLTGLKIDCRVKDDMSLTAKLGRFAFRLFPNSINTKIESSHSKMMAVGLGLKYRICENESCSLFLMPEAMMPARYRMFETLSTAQDGVNESVAIVSEGTYNAVSARLILAKKGSVFVPFAGVHYQKIYLKGVAKNTRLYSDSSGSATGQISNESRYNMALNDKRLGIVCGFDRRLSDQLILSVEGRLVSERAIALELNYRF